MLREAAVQHLAEARTAMSRLDVRVANLRGTLPELVAEHEQARIIVDAGRRGKKDGAAPLPAK